VRSGFRQDGGKRDCTHGNDREQHHGEARLQQNAGERRRDGRPAEHGAATSIAALNNVIDDWQKHEQHQHDKRAGLRFEQPRESEAKKKKKKKK
jgi:hypothetical protein